MSLALSDLGLPFTPWTHQAITISALLPSLSGLGYPDLPVVVFPTGGGKTRVQVALALACQKLGLKLACYTHRKALTKQTAGVFDDFGVSFGLRAAGNKPALIRDTQICAIDTERCRSLVDGGGWDLHAADVVFIDEAHANTHATAQTIVANHIAAGCRAVIGFTATPVDVHGVYNRLIVGANNSDCRECGAHVFAHTYAPNEPELKNIRRNKTGEYSEGAVSRAIMTPTIVGSIYRHFCELNPDARPAIMFAPGVEESIWLCTELRKRGITARHIDADTPDSEREDIEGESRDGICKVVSNRFVLREGVDWPWLYHCIFATAFGGLSNYLQAGGRLLRAHPSLDHVVVQDHGGNWHRHGSLNDDRPWKLGDDNKSIADRVKADRREQTEEQCNEPICCPKCHRLRRAGKPVCPNCGHTHKRSVRMVMQTDGELVRKTGRVTKYKPKPSDLQTVWNQCFYAAKHKGELTFNQIAQQFARRCRAQKLETSGVPFGDDGRPLLRNCPREGAVYWDLPVSEYGKG